MITITKFGYKYRVTDNVLNTCKDFKSKAQAEEHKEELEAKYASINSQSEEKSEPESDKQS